MPPISTEWNDALVTGVSEIDAQHRILFNLLEEARGVADDEDGGAKREAIIRDLLAYAIYHFETEESLIKEYGYDRAEPAATKFHIEEHRRFSGRVVAMRNEHESGDGLLPFLTDWLVNHILTIDRQLGQFIRTRAAGLAASPATPAN